MDLITMDLILFAIGLGYLQAGSNLLQRDLNDPALHRPFYANGGCVASSALCDHHIGVAADPYVSWQVSS
jgi:hypothetical protein